MDTVRMIIADECDQLLDDDFVDQLRGIVSAVGTGVQIALFSATITPAVEKVSALFMNDPVQLRVTEDNLTLSGIRQYYVEVDDRYKMETLLDLYSAINVTQAIIYSHSRARVEGICEYMTENGFPVSMIHGGMTSTERGALMKDFRAGKARILVCTDLMARGIDVQTVGIVLNFDMPKDKETYLHRIGRSGRFGRKGVAITFAGRGDLRKIREVEEFYSTEITEMPEPDALVLV
jgi:translation initiation factor 4A